MNAGSARDDAFQAPLDADLLIEASAGTGKTFALTTLVARLVVEEDRGIDDLLVVTFTVAAAGELRARVRRTLHAARRAVAGAGAGPGDGDQAPKLQRAWQSANVTDQEAHDRLVRALRDFDRATITTIHGFCQQALNEFALPAGIPFSFEVSGDDALAVGDGLRDFWRRRMVDEPIALLEYAKSRGFRSRQGHGRLGLGPSRAAAGDPGRLPEPGGGSALEAGGVARGASSGRAGLGRRRAGRVPEGRPRAPVVQGKAERPARRDPRRRVRFRQRGGSGAGLRRRVRPREADLAATEAQPAPGRRSAVRRPPACRREGQSLRTSLAGRTAPPASEGHQKHPASRRLERPQPELRRPAGGASPRARRSREDRSSRNGFATATPSV